MASTSYAVGRITASQGDVILRPQTRRNTRQGVVYVHGTGSTALAAKGADGTGQQKLLEGLADRGFTIVAADLGASPRRNWGNAEHVARIGDVVTYLLDTIDTPGTKVHLIGTSMGHVGALKYALANPTKVASITGVLPAYDMEAIRVENAGLRAEIDTAWGVTYPAALPAGANPVTDIEDLAGIPWLGYYSSDDSAAFIDGAADCAEALSGSLASLGALGHTDAAIAAVPVNDVAAFLAT